MKKLYKSTSDKKIFGVAAGTANYLGIDVTISRIIWFLFILITSFFPGLLLYLILAWVLPTEGEVKITSEKSDVD
jgi:phage shock protein C